jgi:hypothetical protein
MSIERQRPLTASSYDPHYDPGEDQEKVPDTYMPRGFNSREPARSTIVKGENGGRALYGSNARSHLTTCLIRQYRVLVGTARRINRIDNSTIVCNPME